eukprot:m.15934 g.15934  ORF g.15934 m.15934 type:complete len:285 (+) comp10093_c0_seq1:272-1126(+)
MGQAPSRSPQHNEVPAEIGLENFCRALPTEISWRVFSFLSAQDLGHCAQVCKGWYHLTNDSGLWQYPTLTKFPHLQRLPRPPRPQHWRDLYRTLLQTATLCETHSSEALDFLMSKNFLVDQAPVVACFALSSLSPRAAAAVLVDRADALNAFVQMQDFAGVFLPDAMRQLFTKIQVKTSAGGYLSRLLTVFAEHFCSCNPNGPPKDVTFMLCFSLLLLSVDLHNPHVKRKMTKREFVRNTKRMNDIDEELLGDLFDNIYLYGHVCLPNQKIPLPPIAFPHGGRV